MISAAGDLGSLHDIAYALPDEVAGTQLGVDGKVEKRQVSCALRELKAHTNRINPIETKGTFWPLSLPLLHGLLAWAAMRSDTTFAWPGPLWCASRDNWA
jgi:hypothetical protein